MSRQNYRKCDYCGKEEANPSWGYFTNPDGREFDMCNDCTPHLKEQ